MSFTVDRVPRLEPGAEVSRLGGEFVVLDASGRMLRGLNPTAARVWELVDGQRTAEDIAREVAREYGVAEEQVRADVLWFLTVLEAKGLLAREDAGAPSGVER